MNPDRNPHELCTWKPVSACGGCGIGERLDCRFSWGNLLHFVAMFLGFVIPSVVGMIRGGYGGYFLGWLGFALFFFEVWEIRILCSHCPYYAKRGRTLHCIANYGSLKLWPYRPEPMSRGEKIQLWLGFAILGAYPFPFLIFGGRWAWALMAMWGLALFFWTLRKETCSRCVNFSCPLNGVPKEIVDAYLERNPVMRRAWEESGYKIGGKRR